MILRMLTLSILVLGTKRPTMMPIVENGEVGYILLLNCFGRVLMFPTNYLNGLIMRNIEPRYLKTSILVSRRVRVQFGFSKSEGTNENLPHYCFCRCYCRNI